jgi:DNA-binding MarR family transcriptional regulator
MLDISIILIYTPLRGRQWGKFLRKIRKKASGNGFPCFTDRLCRQKQNRNDKRSYNVRLTAKGTGIRPVILAILKSWTDIISKGLNEEEKYSIIQQLMAMSHKALRATKGQ